MAVPSTRHNWYILFVVLGLIAFPLCVYAANSGFAKDRSFFRNKLVNFKFGKSFTGLKGFKFNKFAQPSYQLFVPPQVATLQQDDKIAIAGDSVTFLGFQPSGWVTLWQQYVQASYPSMNLQFFNYGYPSIHSAELLANFPAVLQNNPTVVFIFIGVNDAGYGTGYLSQQSANIQAMINQCRATPSVRMVVMVSPFCCGEQRPGQNFFDGILDPMTYSQANLAAQNGCPFINLRALWASSELLYNQGNFPYGILTDGPPGVHPSPLGSQLIQGAMIKSFGQ